MLRIPSAPRSSRPCPAGQQQCIPGAAAAGPSFRHHLLLCRAHHLQPINSRKRTLRCLNSSLCGSTSRRSPACSRWQLPIGTDSQQQQLRSVHCCLHRGNNITGVLTQPDSSVLSSSSGSTPSSSSSSLDDQQPDSSQSGWPDTQQAEQSAAATSQSAPGPIPAAGHASSLASSESSTTTTVAEAALAGQDAAAADGRAAQPMSDVAAAPAADGASAGTAAGMHFDASKSSSSSPTAANPAAGAAADAVDAMGVVDLNISSMMSLDDDLDPWGRSVVPAPTVAAVAAADATEAEAQQPPTQPAAQQAVAPAAPPAAQQPVTSFRDGVVASIQDMYGFITRASTIATAQKQPPQPQLDMPPPPQQQLPAQLPQPSQGAAQQEQAAAAAAAIAAVAVEAASDSESSRSAAISRSNSSSSLSSSLSSSDLAALAELQTATERKLADLQHVVEELELDDEEMTQQLTDVLHKLEQLEQDLSAAVHHSLSSSAADSDMDGPASAPVAAAAAEAAAASAVLPVQAAAAALPTQPRAPAPAAGALAVAPAAAAAAAAPASAEARAVAAAAAGAGATSMALPAAVTTVAVPVSSAAAGSMSIAHTEELEALAASASIGGEASSPALDVLAVPSPAAPAAAPAAASDPAKLWPLFVLGLSYVHQATSGFALPALLPMISPDLHLTDFQGALLTSGYSYLYALALVPVGLLADKVDRPKLLAVGLGLWSLLSIVSSGAGSFFELLVARTGFAVAQAAQNPVSFSLIPDLFPANKSTALAGYNCAIYLGRALSFASVLAAHRVRSSGSTVTPVGTMADAAAGNLGDDGVALSMVPLDELDLQRMSIIYTTGDMAAVTPLYNYNFHVIAYEAAAGSEGGWRELLRWIGYPGFAIALLMALSVREPRHMDQSKQHGQQQQRENSGVAAAANLADPSAWREGASNLTLQLLSLATGRGWHHSTDNQTSSSSFISPGSGSSIDVTAQLAGPACIIEPHQATALAAGSAVVSAGGAASAAISLSAAASSSPAAATTAVDESGVSNSSSSSSSSPGAAAAALTQPIHSLLSMKSFQATTIAAALNDLGSYALIAWHSTFYERVFGLDSGVYAPMLAVILPVGGILGGVGGGLIADWLSVVGGRVWLTAGASLLAAPFIAQSLLADSPGGSFSALLVGFALSEAWRAPGAIMIRSVAPQELGSTASALYLCIRNLVGGVGPVAVAKLAEVVGLRQAMLLAPACYVISGLIFWVAEKEIKQQQQTGKQLQADKKQQQLQ